MVALKLSRRRLAPLKVINVSPLAVSNCFWVVFFFSSFCHSLAVQTIEFDEGAGAVLRIQPLRAPRDENTYECVARNSEGEVSVTAKLAIIRGEGRTSSPVLPELPSLRSRGRSLRALGPADCGQRQAASFYSRSSVRPSVIWPETRPASVLAEGCRALPVCRYLARLRVLIE